MNCFLSIPKRQRKHTLCKAISSLLVGFTTVMIPAIALGVERQQSAPWGFNVNIYGWLPDAPATISVDGKDVVEVPEKLDTILESVDAMAMFELEAHKGPLTFFVNTIYYKGDYDDDFTGAVTTLDREYEIEEEVLSFKYGVGYEFGPFNMGESDFSTTLTPWVGGFYFHDDWSVTIKPKNEPLGGKTSGVYKFNTPMVGLVSRSKFSQKWSLSASYAQGGWGEDGVDDIYDAWANLSYHFKTGDTPAKAFFGYRYLDFEWEDGLEALHLTVKGPMFGIGWEF